MRYFKLNNDVHAFDEDQEHLIIDGMVELTDKELNALLNPPPPKIKLAPLTNRQFKLALLNADLIDSAELAISNIEDPMLKRRIQIEYEYATTFERDSESIAVMIDLLELSSDKVDKLWVEAQIL